MLYNCEIEPLHDYVLVRLVDNPNKKTPGGLYIPDTAEAQPVAQVLAVGPGREGIPGTTPSVEKGDLVVLQKYIGTKIDINGTVCLLIKWYDVQAKLKYTDSLKIEVKPDIPEEFYKQIN